jgi:hypothetical protein
MPQHNVATRLTNCGDTLRIVQQSVPVGLGEIPGLPRYWGLIRTGQDSGGRNACIYRLKLRTALKPETRAYICALSGKIQ